MERGTKAARGMGLLAFGGRGTPQERQAPCARRPTAAAVPPRPRREGSVDPRVYSFNALPEIESRHVVSDQGLRRRIETGQRRLRRLAELRAEELGAGAEFEHGVSCRGGRCCWCSRRCEAVRRR